VGIGFLGVACTHLAYPDPKHPPEQIAYVTGSLDSRNVFFRHVFIIAVDGKPLKFWQNQAAILPGSRRLTVGYRYRDPGDRPTQRTTIAFTALAGRSYRLEYFSGKIRVRDRHTNEIVAQQRLP
jgi:hypothetical protein